MDPIPAPRLPEGLRWLNVERPLTKDDLLGRVVVLDFWTGCSVSCMETVGVLKTVRDALADKPVLWIGVHSPKFDLEQEEDWFIESVRRLGIDYPVVSDPERKLWQEYGIEAWPTLVVVGPDGMIYGMAAGEPDPAPLEKVVREVFDHYEEERRISPAPVPAEDLPLRRPVSAQDGRLSYPGKVYATAKGLFVADTGHHQIVACSLSDDGRAEEVRRFGVGEGGFEDGPADRARLQRPNGMALDPAGLVLFVADTGNHAIRKIELLSGEVSTVAGTGDRGHDLPPAGLLAAQSVDLRSPWDVIWDEKREFLTIAMAGSHQLYLYEPGYGGLALLSGTGVQARKDGSTEEATYAQPSGLTLLGERLYVADAESSCIREIEFRGRTVRTICGGDLFDFGDRDGQGDEVLLQHPVGVVADPARNRLLVADSYNHKIKELLPDGTVRTLYGNGDTGGGSLPEKGSAKVAMFFSPEGVDVRDGRLYVADTANHRIVGIDLETHDCWVVLD